LSKQESHHWIQRTMWQWHHAKISCSLKLFQPLKHCNGFRWLANIVADQFALLPLIHRLMLLMLLAFCNKGTMDLCAHIQSSLQHIPIGANTWNVMPIQSLSLKRLYDVSFILCSSSILNIIWCNYELYTIFQVSCPK